MRQFQFNLLYESLIKQFTFSRTLLENFNYDMNDKPSDNSGYTPEEIGDLIDILRSVIYQSNLYFFHILKDMPIIMLPPDSKSCPTMKVNKNRNLFINIGFANELLEGYIDSSGKVTNHNNPFTYVIAHEIYHIVNKTFERQHNRTRMLTSKSGRKISLWNIATDFEMNDLLSLAKSEGGFELTPPKSGCLTDEKGNATFNGFNYNFRGKSAERIYDEIEVDLPEEEGDDGDPGPLEVGQIVKVKNKIYGEITAIDEHGNAEVEPISEQEALKRLKEQQ